MSQPKALIHTRKSAHDQPGYQAVTPASHRRSNHWSLPTSPFIASPRSELLSPPSPRHSLVLWPWTAHSPPDPKWLLWALFPNTSTNTTPPNNTSTAPSAPLPSLCVCLCVCLSVLCMYVICLLFISLCNAFWRGGKSIKKNIKIKLL